jgi:serine/threonine-protein kinase
VSEEVGRYRLLEPIGRGPWGMVFKAHDPYLNRLVALQLVSTRGHIADEVHGRFWRESQDWARLHHPNVAAVYDVGHDEDVLYSTYELVEGLPLSTWMATHGSPPVAQALRWISQVCDALESAHACEVLHGRLEPGHIVVTPEGSAKLLHFGMRAEEPEDVADLLSPTGRVGHMAPEQVWGRLDHRSDIFAVGAVLHELLTGASHLGTGDPADQLRALTEPTLPGTSRDDDGLPEDLADVVGRALARAPEARFSTIGELRDRLDEALVRHLLDRPATGLAAEASRAVPHVPIPPAPLAASSRSGQPRGKRAWRAVGFALAACLLVGLGAAVTYVALSPIERRQAEPGRDGRGPVPTSSTSEPPVEHRPPPVGEPRMGTSRSRARQAVRAVVQARPPAAPATKPPTAPATSLDREPPARVASEQAVSTPAVSEVTPEPPAAPHGPEAENAVTSPGVTDVDRVAWTVEEVRTEPPASGRARWSYRVVLRQEGGSTIWLRQEERAAFTVARGTVDTRAREAVLEPGAEIGLWMTTELAGLASDFPGAATQLVWIWHRFRGVSETGAPVVIDVRFPVYAPAARFRWDGGL